MGEPELNPRATRTRQLEGMAKEDGNAITVLVVHIGVLTIRA